MNQNSAESGKADVAKLGEASGVVVFCALMAGVELAGNIKWYFCVRMGSADARRFSTTRPPAQPDSIRLKDRLAEGLPIDLPRICAQDHVRHVGITTESCMQLSPLEKFKAPLGGQEIELQQVDYPAGGMSLLRIRIREKSRFTVFDIDPATAENWGKAMQQWAQKQDRANG